MPIDAETKRYIDQQIDKLRREVLAGGVTASGAAASGTGQQTVAYAVSAGQARRAAEADVAITFGGTTIGFNEDWTNE